MTPVSLILSGGLALGAYQAGAVATLVEQGDIRVEAVAGASIGSFNAALVLGGEADAIPARLRAFWDAVATEVAASASLFGWPEVRAVRHLTNWANTLSARLGGARGLFRPRPVASGEGSSLYDLSPAGALLESLVDLERLNRGPARLVVAATDVEAGTPVLFDTAAGDAIAIGHLLASGSLMPAFAPMRVDGRLLADGGHSANAPLEPFLASGRAPAGPRVCLLLDLFSPAGAAPTSLERAAERADDLIFGNQTALRLAGIARERALEAALRPDLPGTDLLWLSYPGLPHDAGPEKTYDFSRATLADRWAAGARDAGAALAAMARLPADPAPGLHIHRVRGG